MRLLFLLTLAALLVTMVWLVVADLIAHPHDRWTALLFVLGTAIGIVLERDRPRRG